MGVSKTSSTSRRYLLGILAPNNLAVAVRRIIDGLDRSRWSGMPLPPMLPLAESSEPPRPPVPGLLPPPDEAFRPSGRLVPDATGTWLIWPVDTRGWLAELKAGLDGDAPTLMPDEEGLPVAVSRQRAFDSFETIDAGGWKTVVLACWQIDYLTDRPWSDALVWRPLWRRRLRRAGSAAKIRK